MLVDEVVDRHNVPSVEPHLEHRTVAGQDFCELLAIDLVVGGLLLRGGRAPAVSSALCVVTRTKIDAQANSAGLASLGEFSEHVTLALLPRRDFEGIIGSSGLPGAVASHV